MDRVIIYSQVRFVGNRRDVIMMPRFHLKKWIMAQLIDQKHICKEKGKLAWVWNFKVETFIEHRNRCDNKSVGYKECSWGWRSGLQIRFRVS